MGKLVNGFITKSADQYFRQNMGLRETPVVIEIVLEFLNYVITPYQKIGKINSLLYDVKLIELSPFEKKNLIIVY